MSSSSGLLLLAVVMVFGVWAAEAMMMMSEGHSSVRWIPAAARCEGSMAECMGDDREFEMDSEINRRILATTQYISYGALQRNTVPCSQRGASYYNCKAGAQANPYNRGCSAITRCRS